MPEFFQKQRRKIELEDWHPLMNAQGEKRIRFDLLMPLTGQPYVGFPKFANDAYEKMELENSSIKDIDLTTEIEEVTVELYATESSEPMEIEWGVGLDEAKADADEKKRKLLLTGSTLRQFKLVRVTREKANVVALRFNITTKSTRGLAAWAHDHHGKTMWAEFSIDSKPKKKAAEEPQLPLAKDFCTFPGCTLDADHAGDHKTVVEINRKDDQKVAAGKR
jgi:hypothetical protein